MKIIHLGNIAPCHYEKGELGAEPALKSEQPTFETVTTINVSPDSSVAQAVAEILNIWDIHSHNDAPEWIGHNAEGKLLALLLGEHFGIADIREIAE